MCYWYAPFALVGSKIPAVVGHRAVFGQERITERLLSSARDSGQQPVGVRNVGGANDVNVGHVDDMMRGQYVRRCVERLEAFVNRDFQDRCRRIERTIDDADAYAVPPAAGQESAFATIPGRRVTCRIEAPGDELAASQWLYGRRHA
ncbi:hypothetical protein A6X20_40655 [Bradyrhizobium elkanii]|nr:hypothetical protein A6X20_40655 [Bradyrhizobium elkanii]ODM75172.1 hypothetical protein A6452_38260 [Bradyrhizobium elkanii]